MRTWGCEAHGIIKEVSSSEVVFRQPTNCPICYDELYEQED